MKEQQDNHMRNKNAVRALKEHDKSESQNDSTFTAACFDLEQVLTCPSGTNSQFIISVYELGTGKAHCHMWHEGIAGRGVNEICSCVYQFLLCKAVEGVKVVTIYCDNCGAQNKNRPFLAMLKHVVNTTRIDKITISYLEKGHTQNENDSVHAAIESSKRHVDLFVPEQYYSLARGARKTKAPYRVVEMTAEEFLDFKSISLRNTKIGTDNDVVLWPAMKHISVCKGSTLVTYRNQHWAVSITLIQTGNRVGQVMCKNVFLNHRFCIGILSQFPKKSIMT